MEDIGALVPETTTLLIMDMQNDFCHPKGVYATVGDGVHKARAIIPKIKDALNLARQRDMTVVFTALTVRPGVPDVPKVHTIMPKQFRGMKTRLVHGTWGAELVEELQPLESERILHKPAYSAFYQTDLELYLRRKGVKTLLLTGVATNACVLHTALDAFVRDFDVVVLRDAVAAIFEDLHDGAMKNIETIIGVATTTEELAKLLAIRRMPTAGAAGETK